jgi:D-beta-D-heptose 7-phosphate kinase/D-beta-D-heptose 1-phosphate adenosyltransferase
MISQKRANKIFENFSNKRILVFGDIIFDRYVFGTVDRISPEAPIPVVKVKREDFRIGGAGNVASNIDSLGSEGLLLGIVGDDIYSKEIFKLKNKNNLAISSTDNQTLIKTRILAKRQQIVRVDREEEIIPSKEDENKIINTVNTESFDGIIVSDYAKGTLNKNIMNALKERAEKSNIPIFVDPKPPNFAYYKGVSGITPNKIEAESIVGRKFSDEKDIISAIRTIQKRFKTKYTLITRGTDGITAAERGKKAFTIPVYSREVFDVTGAGDTVASVLILSLVSGASLKEAVILSNIAASIAIEKIGTAQVSVNEILNRLKNKKNNEIKEIF